MVWRIERNARGEGRWSKIGGQRGVVKGKDKDKIRTSLLRGLLWGILGYLGACGNKQVDAHPRPTCGVLFLVGQKLTPIPKPLPPLVRDVLWDRVLQIEN